MRDLTHFDTLERLLALERSCERARLAERRATLPLAALELEGLVWLDLEAQESRGALGGRTLVTFRRFDGQPLRARAAPGDLVAVAPRKAALEQAPTGVVAAATRTGLQVAFDRPPPPWLDEGRLRLDKLASDVTWERARASVAEWRGAERGRARDRRDVLLGQRPARFDRPPAFEPSRPLNPEQRAAVELALAAQDFALVHGPPGTGKSTVLAEVAVQAAARGQRLLCTAASNAAVDHLLELCLDAGLDAVRVGHPARVLPRLRAHTLDELVEANDDRRLAAELYEEAFEQLGYARRQRATGRSRERFAKARAAKADARALLDEARALERRAVRGVLERARVVCATLSGLGGRALAGEAFDLCLLDEATQALEPLALAAFLKAPIVILAGDPLQLAPTVLSPEAAAQGLGVSLFERVLADQGEGVKRLLEEQHRMSEALMAFPSRETYGGALRAHPAVAHRTLREVLRPDAELDAPPFVFLDTAGKGFAEAAGEGGASLVNEGEAGLVVARARALLAAGLAPAELAVITPYSAQALLLREALADVDELELDTVDAFQGREKDAVLLSLVRSNDEQALGFLEDLRRLNVALTRARRHLFVVGDSATLATHPTYARLVEAAQSCGGYRSAWEWTEASSNAEDAA